MRHLVAAAVAAAVVLTADAANANPNETIAQSQQVLAELLAIPGRSIPTRLLNEAQGVAIIPRVIKIGFVAGVRRGQGVVLVRDADGSWSLPRFVRLTGGSVGWQAGVQGTDVVLVFRTRRSVENLLRGKFTIGVDAAAAAGPVGRNAAAATDATLQAEILSYSRSRGLFLGASVDGSVIEIDQTANTAFYGSPDPETPQAVPLAATQLQSFVMELSGGVPELAPATAPLGAPALAAAANPAAPPAAVTPLRTEALRLSLASASTQLTPLLNADWQKFLALPASVANPAAPANPAEIAMASERFEKVATDPQFASLAQRPEFQYTMELLHEYAAAVQAGGAVLQLPAPPVIDNARRERAADRAALHTCLVINTLLRSCA